MDTSREDVSIAIRSAFLSKGTKQRFSLLALIALSCALIYFENFNAKPLNYFRSFIKDTIFRGSMIISLPGKNIKSFFNFIDGHLTLYDNYKKLSTENEKLKNNILKSDFLELENMQLRKLIEEQVTSPYNFVSARVMLDKQSPYLNSFVINIGGNKGIKNGMSVLDGNNFIGRITDVNFFSSRILLVSDLNSKIPIISQPSGYHAILSGRGGKKGNLEYLPENHRIQQGEKIYTSGKEGIFPPGIPIGKVILEGNKVFVSLFSDLQQITFVNVNLGDFDQKE